MDFDDTPEEAAFRAEARAFLAAHAKPKAAIGQGRVMGFGGADEDAHVKRAKEWQAILHANGWAGISWPKEYGGRGAKGMSSAIFNQEAAKYDVSSGPFTVGIGMAGPTLMAHGTEEQKKRFLDPMLKGDEIWCQLFSEPEAGSDLAGLKTRAVRDGDEWVVNGQKVWTSGAHHSDWGILLARTNPDAPKHRGITYFLVDMRTPGIEVRPLRQITGHAHFNEVFLTDVRIPAENVVGEVNGGWGVAVTTLANERTAIGGGGGGLSFTDLADHARAFGRTGEPLIRQELAQIYIRTQVMKYIGFRVQTAISKGVMPGPESSILKSILSRHLAHIGDFVMTVQGGNGMLAGDWADSFLSQWAARIGGGTDQIQKNIIGERVLGLPGEPRTDKNVPFNQIGKPAAAG